MQGIGQFVDQQGILKGTLHDKRTESDILHIKENGYKILVKCIKSTIFSLKNNRSKYQAGRSYSTVVRS